MRLVPGVVLPLTVKRVAESPPCGGGVSAGVGVGVAEPEMVVLAFVELLPKLLSFGSCTPMRRVAWPEAVAV